MSGDLSQNEKKILKQLVNRGGYVSDDVLWKAAEIGPVAYETAALDLIKEKYAETQAQISDPSSLKATPTGMRRAREL